MTEEDASRWSSFDVQIWLAQSGFAAYVGVFRDNDVNGKLLLKLDAGTLRDDFGINVPEDRERLLTAITSLRKAPQVFNAEDWNEEDVCNWVASLGMPQLVHTLRLYRITGPILLRLKAEDLKDDLGIHSFGVRDKLLEHIKQLRLEVQGSAKFRKSGSENNHVRTSPRETVEMAGYRQDRDGRREIILNREIAAAKNRVTNLRDKMKSMAESLAKAEDELAAMQDELDAIRKRQTNAEEGKIRTELFKKSPHFPVGSSVYTFQPAISSKSKQIVANLRSSQTPSRVPRPTLPFNHRQLQSGTKAGREGSSSANTTTLEEHANKMARREAAEFVKAEFGVDVESEEALARLREIVDQPDSVDLTEKQKTAMRGMTVWPLAVALHNAHKIASFYARSVAHAEAKEVAPPSSHPLCSYKGKASLVPTRKDGKKGGYFSAADPSQICGGG